MKASLRLVFVLGLSVTSTLWSQVSITGTSYTQDFNSIGSGLPTGGP